MNGHFLVWVMAVAVKISQSYNMDPITRSPVSETSPLSTNDILFEFESHRNPTLQAMSGRIRLEEVVDLCDAVERDDNTLVEASEKKLYYLIPVKPKTGDGLPTFTVPCFGWKRRPCLGLPKPPFDYRCAYWTPYSLFGGDDCGGDDDVARKKRMTRPYESIAISGIDAISLCATAAGLDLGTKQVQVASIALPTNEGSDLRCINWILSPEGGWIREDLEEPACSKLNAKRPMPYVDNEINSEEGVLEDLFAEVVKCESTGRKIDCAFQREPGRGIKY